MKFVARKGTESFEKLTALRSDIDLAKKAAHDLTEALGFESHYSYNDVCGTGIASFASKTQPEGYKRMSRGFFPKATKANKPLLDRINALPKVRKSDIGHALNYSMQTYASGHGIGISTCPGIQWGTEFCLIDVHDDVKWPDRPADLEELRQSEYFELKAELERETEGEKVN